MVMFIIQAIVQLLLLFGMAVVFWVVALEMMARQEEKIARHKAYWEREQKRVWGDEKI